MFNSLINGKDGEISRAGKAANDEERLQAAERHDRTIGKSVGPVNVIGTGKVERFFWNRFAFVFEQRLCIAPKKFNDVRHTAIILSKRSLSRSEVWREQLVLSNESNIPNLSFSCNNQKMCRGIW